MYSRALNHSTEGYLEQNKTLVREINLAKNIQTKLLNGDTPELEHDEITGTSIPARLIGGDYFDFYPLPDGRLRIVIGDVMGKGIPAAMLMILTRGAFRTAAEHTETPSETLTAMNKAMYTDLRKLNSFVTMLCADWEPETGSFTYANAGHSLPIVIKGDGSAVDLPEVKGVMLGGLPNQVYIEDSVDLVYGDLVFLYTDGIIEAQNNTGKMFKKDRLVRLLQSIVKQSATQVESSVLREVNSFTEGLPQKDDITSVTLKVGSR